MRLIWALRWLFQFWQWVEEGREGGGDTDGSPKLHPRVQFKEEAAHNQHKWQLLTLRRWGWGGVVRRGWWWGEQRPLTLMIYQQAAQGRGKGLGVEEAWWRLPPTLPIELVVPPCCTGVVIINRGWRRGWRGLSPHYIYLPTR